jgi:2-keto-4-pentenoate hydratase/2-oxohepta-3-ene-1,7-dioic acid hydratase in catechol pathway
MRATPLRPSTASDCFSRRSSALVGPAAGIALRNLDRRSDHEVELRSYRQAGQQCVEEKAPRLWAEYAIGLDLHCAVAEERSFRKSTDSYAVLGPWLVTADEIPEPNNLRLSLSVNGEVRQDSSTNRMIMSVRELIAYASRFYTLLPGDIIMTVTPEGVSPIVPGTSHVRLHRENRFDWRSTFVRRNGKPIRPAVSSTAG